MMNLAKQVSVVRHSNAVAAGTTDIEPSTGIDMANYDGVMFLIAFGTITANAVTSVKVQQSDDSAGSPDSFSDLEGTSITVADDDDNKIAIIDVYRPEKRYLRVVVDRGTQNAVLDSISAIRYNPRVLPATHDATTVLGHKVHATPAEGTA